MGLFLDTLFAEDKYESTTLPCYITKQRSHFIDHSTTLAKNGHILETAGTGEHLTYFAKKHPLLLWQPSDKNDELFWAIHVAGVKIYQMSCHPKSSM